MAKLTVRSAMVSAAMIAAWAPGIALADFNPKLSEICKGGEISRPMLVGVLLEAYKIQRSNLDPEFEKNIDYTTMASAVVAPGKYCGAGERNCRKSTVSLLGQAQTDLAVYLNRHTKPLPAGSSGVVIERVRPSPSADERKKLPIASLLEDPDLPENLRPDVPVEEFLETKSPFFRTTCVQQTPVAGRGDQAGDQASVPQRPLLRAKIEDLKYDQEKNKDSFKKLDRAGLSVNNDLLAHSKSFGIQGVAGYGFGRTPLAGSIDNFWQTAVFGTYTRQYVDGSNPKKLNNVNNVGIGASGDITFLFGGLYHNLQLFPHFVHSVKSGADVLSASLVYTPMPDWGGIGTIFVPGELFAFQMKPQLKSVYGHVFDDGGDPNLSRTSNFGRVGPRLELVASAWENTILEGLTLNAAYDYLYGFQGQHRVVRRFETSLNYALPAQDYIGLQLKYIDGRNLDTLEKQRIMTFGIGVKY